MIFLIFFLITLIYLLYILYFYLFQDKLIYPGRTRKYEQPYGAVFENVSCSDVEQYGDVWFFKGKGEAPWPLLIIAHGNGSLINDWIEFVKKPISMGLSVLLVEFPGYGRSNESISQEAITNRFIKAYDTIIKRDDVESKQIAYFGRSLGGGVVSSLAHFRKPDALILSSTFVSMQKMIQKHGIPSLLLKDEYNTIDTIEKYDGPLLITHGLTDKTIPYAHALSLHSVHSNSSLLTLKGGHINSVQEWELIWNETGRFLSQNGFSLKLN